MNKIGLSLKLKRFIPWLDDRCLQRAGFQEIYEKEVYEWNA